MSAERWAAVESPLAVKKTQAFGSAGAAAGCGVAGPVWGLVGGRGVRAIEPSARSAACRIIIVTPLGACARPGRTLKVTTCAAVFHAPTGGAERIRSRR